MRQPRAEHKMAPSTLIVNVQSTSASLVDCKDQPLHVATIMTATGRIAAA